MNEKYIPIGKMALINHVTIPALRLYDEMNLLKPAWIDPVTNYRYYQMGQCARLDMICYMKELGMSLEEISSVFEKEDIVFIEEILAQKNEQLHAQMRELKARHDAVERAINSIERYRKSPLTGTTSLEYIDRRYIWSIKCSRNFYDTGLSDYEYVLNELRHILLEKDVKQVHTYNVGTSIRQTDYEALNYQADKVFVFTDEHFAFSDESEMLDSGMYACIYLDSYDAETDGAKQLLDFCHKHSYRISGDYICEVMTEFNVFDASQRNMYLRLQVPVKFDR